MCKSLWALACLPWGSCSTCCQRIQYTPRARSWMQVPPRATCALDVDLQTPSRSRTRCWTGNIQFGGEAEHLCLNSSHAAQSRHPPYRQHTCLTCKYASWIIFIPPFLSLFFFFLKLSEQHWTMMENKWELSYEQLCHFHVCIYIQKQPILTDTNLFSR